MNETLEKAKKLFFDYSCNKFFMSRDGMDIEFEKMGITKEQEAEWRNEYINYWIVQLSLDDLEAVNMLNYAWGVEAIPDLIIMCNRAEGYAKLWYANTIWNLATGTKLQADIRKQATETSLKAWESLLDGNFNIPEYFRKKIISSMLPINTATPEVYVVNYAKRQLEEAKKRGE